MTDFEEFEQKQKKPLDFGNAFNDTFEIYKMIALPAGSALLIVSTILLVLVFAGIGFFVKDMDAFAEQMKNFKPEHLSEQGKLIYVGAMTLIYALLAPFIAGILKMAHDADHNEEVKFSSVGYYVNSSRFIHIVLNVAILTAFSVGLDLYLSPQFQGLGKYITILITFPVSILVFISMPLILFKDLNVFEAFSKSIRLVSQKFFLVLILFILVNILALAGLLALCFGIIFTIPIVYAMQYVIYKSLAE